MTSYLILNPSDKYAITIQPDALELKRKALETLAGIKQVTTKEELQAAADALASAAGVVKSMEKTRVEVKQPVLDAGRRIDSTAADFSKPIDDAMDPVRTLVSRFQQAENERVRREREQEEKRQFEAEQARLAEEARILEERQAREKQEMADKLKAEAELNLTQAPNAKESEDPLAAMLALNEEEERAEQSKLATEAENARLAKIEADRIASQNTLATRPRVAKASGVSSRTVWKFEVIDIAEVYKVHANLCHLEINTSAVNQLINAHQNPLRTCPGLRIYEETVTAVRAK